MPIRSNGQNINIRFRESLWTIQNDRKVWIRSTSASTRFPFRPAPPGASNRAVISAIWLSIASRIFIKFLTRSFKLSIFVKCRLSDPSNSILSVLSRIRSVFSFLQRILFTPFDGGPRYPCSDFQKRRFHGLWLQSHSPFLSRDVSSHF